MTKYKVQLNTESKLALQKNTNVNLFGKYEIEGLRQNDVFRFNFFLNPNKDIPIFGYS